MELGIKQAMASKHVSSEAVARLLNVHRNTVANKINGETPFTMAEGFLLKQALFPEYDIAFLFCEQIQTVPEVSDQAG